MVRAASVENPSLTEMVAEISRNSATETTNRSVEAAKENRLKLVKVIGPARDVTTATSPGERNASVAMLQRMEPKVEHRAAENHSEEVVAAVKGNLSRRAKGTGLVPNVTTAISLGEQSASVATSERMALHLREEIQVVDSAVDVADEATVAAAAVELLVVAAVEPLVAVVVDSTNHSVASITRTSRLQTRRSSSTTKANHLTHLNYRNFYVHQKILTFFHNWWKRKL